MKKNTSTFKYILDYAIPPFITLLLGIIILAVKEIYPFGPETVDYHDLSAQISSFYYHIWDTLHGSKIYFFDWYSALGTNMSVASSGSGFFSIFNLFLLFAKRDYIMESMSFFLLMKMAFMSLTMYILVHKMFNSPKFIEIMVSVGYGFCGFILMNYTIINWPDLAIFSPLIVYYAEKLLREGSMKGFIITLSLGLIHNYYLSFILLFYLFLEAGLYLLINYKDFKRSFEQNHPHVLKLGLGVILSLGISAVIVLPQLLQTMSSTRLNNSSSSLFETYFSILSQNGGYVTRWWALFGLSFALSGILIGLICDLKKKNFRRFLWIFGSLFMVLIPLIFENVNLFWHFGSYVHYPIRYGFLLNITVALALCSYSEDIVTEENLLSGKKWKYAMLLIAIPIFYVGYIWYAKNPGMTVSKVVHVTLLYMAFSFILYLIIRIIDNGKYIRLSMIIWASEILFYGLLTIGSPTYITGFNEEPEQEKQSVKTCTELFHDFDLKAERIIRVKNPDESLNANYGFYLRQPTLSNWTHLVSPSIQKGAAKLGYSWQFTRLLDAGGTAFSDALLNIDHVISNQEQDSSMYSLNKTATVSSGMTYYLYDSNYNLPFGLIANSEADLNSIDKCDNIVDLYNTIVESVSTETNPIAAFEECRINEPYEISLNGQKALYLIGNCQDREYRNLTILVNGNAVSIPTIGDYDNTLYPAHFNNNVIALGTYKDESVRIELQLKDVGEKPYDIQLFSLDLDVLESLCNSYLNYSGTCLAGTHSLDYTVNASSGNYLLLPIAYNKGWSCKVNSLRVSPINVLDLFIAVPLFDGENQISMNYIPSGLILGAIISIIMMLLAILTIRISKEKYLIGLNRILLTVYAAVWSVVIIGMFIVPIAYTICQKLFKL